MNRGIPILGKLQICFAIDFAICFAMKAMKIKLLQRPQAPHSSLQSAWWLALPVRQEKPVCKSTTKSQTQDQTKSQTQDQTDITKKVLYTKSCKQLSHFLKVKRKPRPFSAACPFVSHVSPPQIWVAVFNKNLKHLGPRPWFLRSFELICLPKSNLPKIRSFLAINHTSP